MSGLFVAYGGLSNVGKTEQSRKLYAELCKIPALYGQVYLFETEAATEIGKEIKELIVKYRNKPHSMTAITEVLLHMAKRAELYKMIKQLLAQGKIVICVHSPHSTLAYQGYGEKVDKGVIRSISEYATGGLFPQHPEIVIFPYRDKIIYSDPEFKFSAAQLQVIQNGFLEMAKKDHRRWLPINLDHTQRLFQNCKDKKNFVFTTWDHKTYKKPVKDYWDIVFEYTYKKVEWALAADLLSIDNENVPIGSIGEGEISERIKKLSRA